jgi:hypothetical protein
MSEALVWQLIRGNNSYLIKRGRTRRDGSVQFSTERGNLLSVNSHKYSGIANHHTLDISVKEVKDNDKTITSVELKQLVSPK